MSTSTSSSTSTLPFQQLAGDFYSRRLLLHTPLYQSSAPGNSFVNRHNSSESGDSNTFDANVVMVLSVLLCALICSLGLNSIVRCALRCSSLLANSSDENYSSSRLATTGVKRKALRTFPTFIYSAGLTLPGLDVECAICLSEFTTSERIRVLPKCHHGFHVRCIDKWLGSHSSCPTCRHCLIDTCQKIICCSQAPSIASVPSSIPPPPPLPPQQETVVINIAPLEHEDLVRIYRPVN